MMELLLVIGVIGIIFIAPMWHRHFNGKAYDKATYNRLGKLAKVHHFYFNHQNDEEAWELEKELFRIFVSFRNNKTKEKANFLKDHEPLLDEMLKEQSEINTLVEQEFKNKKIEDDKIRLKKIIYLAEKIIEKKKKETNSFN